MRPRWSRVRKGHWRLRHDLEGSVRVEVKHHPAGGYWTWHDGLSRFVGRTAYWSLLIDGRLVETFLTAKRAKDLGRNVPDALVAVGRVIEDAVARFVGDRGPGKTDMRAGAGR